MWKQNSCIDVKSEMDILASEKNEHLPSPLISEAYNPKADKSGNSSSRPPMLLLVTIVVVVVVAELGTAEKGEEHDQAS